MTVENLHTGGDLSRWTAPRVGHRVCFGSHRRDIRSAVVQPHRSAPAELQAPCPICV
jgi:hypothetical protein